MFVSGLVDLILGGIIVAGLPGAAEWAIGLLVGINMVFGGVALIAMALQARRIDPAVPAAIWSWSRYGMNDLALKKHRLLLDLVALEADLSRVIMLNAEPPLMPENQAISQGLVRARELVQGLIAKLQK
jgi:hypothetical protein